VKAGIVVADEDDLEKEMGSFTSDHTDRFLDDLLEGENAEVSDDNQDRKESLQLHITS